jgi:hypothetical protein
MLMRRSALAVVTKRSVQVPAMSARCAAALVDALDPAYLMGA